jgi:hypothetical protein
MPRPSLKSDLLKTLSVVATIPSCFLIFYGGFVLVRFGANSSLRDLLLFALLPVVGGVCWLVLAAWFWSRAILAESVWDSIGLISLRALGAIALASLGAWLLTRFHGR